MTNAVTARQNESEKKNLWYLLASVLVHASIMFLIEQNFKHSWETKTSTPIELEIVDLGQTKTNNQIVQTKKVEKSEKTADNAYLGEQTQIVETQTRAKNIARYSEARAGGAKASKPTLAQEKQKPTELKDLGVKMNFTPMGNLGPHTPLPPSVGASNDYLKDLQNGAETMLNTKEFKFFAFFQRVRQQLEQYWEPGLRERLKKMVDRGREIAAEKEHSTTLMVVLNTEGVITKIQIEGTSGFLDLDQAAIDAFNRAGPFPNPPKGMIEKDGTVKVQWEFVLRT